LRPGSPDPAALPASPAALRGLRWLLGLLLSLLLVTVMAQGEGVELSHLSTERSEDGLLLSFGTRYDLPRPVEDALQKGLPIYFVAEASLYRSRWYWRDARVGNATRTWRLSWQPLTRQYRVSTGGLTQSYVNLREAMDAVRGVSGWRIAEPREIDDDGKHYLEFSYRLDTSQLPRPMQIGLSSSQGWLLSVERSFNLNADYSTRPAP
jgi:hypothetical protein